jgi:hypothetical protein
MTALLEASPGPLSPSPLRRQLRWLVPLTAAVLVSAALLAVFTFWRPSPNAYSAPTASRTPAATSAAAVTVTGSPTRQPQSTPLTGFPAQVTQPQLAAIADALIPAATDGHSGPVQHVTCEYWARDNAEMAPFLNENWLRPDYSAVTKRWALPNRPPNFDADQVGHTDFHTVIPSVLQTPARDISEYAKPLPDNAQALFERLRVIDRDGHLAVADVLGVYRVVNEWQIPSKTTRAAYLRLLAHLPDLGVKPVVRDRLGRAGIAVTTHADGATYSLIFDTSTGELLAYELMMVDVAIGGPAITLPAPGETELFTDRRFTSGAEV